MPRMINPNEDPGTPTSDLLCQKWDFNEASREMPFTRRKRLP
jgi:hypothetical protein